MKRIYILVEGQTEENFVKTVLAQYLEYSEIYLTPICVGGYTSYSKIKKQLLNLLSTPCHVSTMFDYYKLPHDFPGKDKIDKSKRCYDNIKCLEESLKKDINNLKFIPYIQLHEFEALLFSSPQAINNNFPDENYIEKLKEISKTPPEEINDGVNTAPSKRLKNIFRRYQKVVHGSLIAKEIGIELIKQKCPHFSEWLEKLSVIK